MPRQLMVVIPFSLLLLQRVVGRVEVMPPAPLVQGNPDQVVDRAAAVGLTMPPARLVVRVIRRQSPQAKEVTVVAVAQTMLLIVAEAVVVEQVPQEQMQQRPEQEVLAVQVQHQQFLARL